MLKYFAEVFGLSFGIGVLILPYLFQKAGVIAGTLILALTFLLLIPLAYIFQDVVIATGKDPDSAVAEYFPLKWLPIFSLSLFTYGALTAYIISAGDQVSALIGYKPEYWSALFFALAVYLLAMGKNYSQSVQTAFSTLLFIILAALIPRNAVHASGALPSFTGLKFIFPLISVSIFALFGHQSIYYLQRELKNREKVIQIFLSAYSLVFLVYILYALTAAYAVRPISLVSTASLLSIYTPATKVLVSLLAVLAFLTSFYSIAREWLSYVEDSMKKGAAYAFLFFPVAVLYILERRGAISLLDIVARIGSLGIFLYIFTLSYAHYRIARERKTEIPGAVSLLFSLIFLFLSILCFLPFELLQL